MEARSGPRPHAEGELSSASQVASDRRVWSLTNPPGFAPASPQSCRTRLAAVWHRYLEYRCIDATWHLLCAGRASFVAVSDWAGRCAAWVAHACAAESPPAVSPPPPAAPGQCVADAPVWGSPHLAREEPASAADEGGASAHGYRPN